MLKTFSITDIGQRRKLNQDYTFTSERPVGNLPNLFIVADGMGGHKAGDYASKCTVETIVETARECKAENPETIIQEAVEAANRKVYDTSLANEDMNGMGSTVVVATCRPDGELIVANVGDSRLYLIGHKIEQITRDHSLVEEMVRCGSLTREDARNRKDKNIITRAIGVSETVEMDFFHVRLQEEDMILMCSDGLTNMLEDTEIKMIVDSRNDIVGKAQELVNAANRNGGKDNIAVVLIEPFAKNA